MITVQKNRLEKSFESEQSRLLAFVRSKIHSPEESEDLLQDVFLQALTHLNVLEAVDNMTAWLYTVTKNRIIDWYRKRKIPTRSIHQPDENGNDLQDILTEESFDDWDDSTRKIVYETIIESIDELAEKQKQVFIRQVVDGMTFREIAEETGESINTLIARKRYAVQFLRHRLKEIKDLLKDS